MLALEVDRARVQLELARRNWTQAKLADLVGVSRQAIHMWLHGRSPAPRLAGQVAQAFGLPLEELLREPAGSARE